MGRPSIRPGEEDGVFWFWRVVAEGGGGGVTAANCGLALILHLAPNCYWKKISRTYLYFGGKSKGSVA